MKKTKKILGLSILGFAMVGFAYLWITDIQPDIDRVNKIQQDMENQPSYMERLDQMTVEDCKRVTGTSPIDLINRCIEMYRNSSP